MAFGWGIFYYTDMGLWRVFVGRLFGFRADSVQTLRFAAAYLPTFLVACVTAGWMPKKALTTLRERGRYLPEILLLAVLFLLSTSALVSQRYNPFIYFRF